MRHGSCIIKVVTYVLLSSVYVFIIVGSAIKRFDSARKTSQEGSSDKLKEDRSRGRKVKHRPLQEPRDSGNSKAANRHHKPSLPARLHSRVKPDRPKPQNNRQRSDSAANCRPSAPKRPLPDPPKEDSPSLPSLYDRPLSVILQLQKITQDDNHRISLSISTTNRSRLGTATKDDKKEKQSLCLSKSDEFSKTSTNLDRRARSVSPLSLSTRASENSTFYCDKADSGDDTYEEISDGETSHNVYEEFSDVSNLDNDYIYPISRRQDGSSLDGRYANSRGLYSNSAMENIYDSIESVYANSSISSSTESLSLYANGPFPDWSSLDSRSSRSLPKKPVQSNDGGTSDVVDNAVHTPLTVRAAGNDDHTTDTRSLVGLSVSVPNLHITTAESSPRLHKTSTSLISKLQKGGLTLECPILHRISNSENGPY